MFNEHYLRQYYHLPTGVSDVKNCQFYLKTFQTNVYLRMCTTSAKVRKDITSNKLPSEKILQLKDIRRDN
jgi:hypothetical protein